MFEPPAPLPPTVYVIQTPRPKSDGWTPNLEPASKYGKIEFVFPVGEKAWADPESSRHRAAERLKDFDPTRDYLCWANFGDPACLWIVIGMLVARGARSLKFLYWSRGRNEDGSSDKTHGHYFPVEIHY